MTGSKWKQVKWYVVSFRPLLCQSSMISIPDQLFLPVTVTGYMSSNDTETYASSLFYPCQLWSVSQDNHLVLLQVRCLHIGKESNKSIKALDCWSKSKRVCMNVSFFPRICPGYISGSMCVDMIETMIVIKLMDNMVKSDLEQILLCCRKVGMTLFYHNHVQQKRHGFHQRLQLVLIYSIWYSNKTHPLPYVHNPMTHC